MSKNRKNIAFDAKLRSNLLTLFATIKVSRKFLLDDAYVDDKFKALCLTLYGKNGIDAYNTLNQSADIICKNILDRQDAKLLNITRPNDKKGESNE